MHMIRVSDATHQKIQLLAAVRRVSMSRVVDQGINATLRGDEISAMRALLAATDPRTPDQIAQDEHAAQVLDTPEVTA
jgi:hypothetical protein